MNLYYWAPFLSNVATVQAVLNSATGVKKYSKKESNGTDEFFITTNLKKIKVPNFLISKSGDNVNNQDIIDGLNLISEYLQTNLFLPNSINFPHQRKKFIDDFKS